jgi:hypothetical protein
MVISLNGKMGKFHAERFKKEIEFSTKKLSTCEQLIIPTPNFSQACFAFALKNAQIVK